MDNNENILNLLEDLFHFEIASFNIKDIISNKNIKRYYLYIVDKNEYENRDYNLVKCCADNIVTIQNITKEQFELFKLKFKCLEL